MFNILKAAVEATPVVEARKLTFIEMVKAVFRRAKNKRAYKALCVAKREEKAAVLKTNAQLADELQVRADALTEQSAMCYRTDPVESDRLCNEAIELATQAAQLRFN